MAILLDSFPRDVYRRLRNRREVREERSFRTLLGVDANAPELVLSPHWDDAVLDCWGLLSSDRALSVVNVFAGVPTPGGIRGAWDAITGARDSAERARERIAEDAGALARAGRTATALDFLDAQYRPPPRAPRLEDLDRALAGSVQRAARVYVPAGLGGHPDHMLVRRYGRMLSRAGMPVTLYADLPYCAIHGWPHWVDGTEPDPHRNIDAFWMSFLEKVPEMRELRSARVERLDDQAAAAKLEAMRCYVTQLPALDYGARGVLVDPAIHRFEVSWELAGS